ncbi:hypothetical protein C7441_10725 [Pseudaminobacter salicylatoxidans]|uniref:Uncharacterized protein n=1 Tax=Pseudaminobacter salicylatoxidans TaxID=93369 RepID=A0A316C4G2_PSESE|nr:hypothetical protein C7441_10725 [Pseudaminobacter salicylatoxidans]
MGFSGANLRHPTEKSRNVNEFALVYPDAGS